MYLYDWFNVFFSILVRLAEGELISDAEIQKSALRVICNCVCGPTERVRLYFTRII